MHLSFQRIKIMQAFYEGGTAELSGADIMRLTGLGSGSAYPILVVFEEHGILQSRWEGEAPQTLGRPRRRLYKLTDLGADVYKRAMADLAPSRPLLPSLWPSEA
jgi:PadR family transcriptional regulator PadR